MKLKIYRGKLGHLHFKRQFKNLKEKVKKQEIIIVQLNKDIHVIDINNLIDNELINNGIKNLILNNIKIYYNHVKTMFILELLYRRLN